MAGMFYPTCGANIGQGGMPGLSNNLLQAHEDPAVISDVNLGPKGGAVGLVATGIFGGEVTYTRIDPTGKTYDPVTGKNKFLPIPQLNAVAGRIGIGSKVHVTFGLTLAAPCAPLPSYPKPEYDTLEQVLNAPRATTRYSLVTIGDKTALASVGLPVSIQARVGEKGPIFTLGLAFKFALISLGGLETALNVSNIYGPPQIPFFDVPVTLGPDGHPIVLVAPTGTIALQMKQAIKDGVYFRLSGILDLPTYFSGSKEGGIHAEKPVAEIFNPAEIQGTNVERIAMQLPLRVNAAGELRVRWFSLKLGYGFTQTSKQDKITVKTNTKIAGVPAIGDYNVPEINLPLYDRDSHQMAASLGGYWLLSGNRVLGVDVGASRSTGATSEGWTQPLMHSPQVSYAVGAAGRFNFPVSPAARVELLAAYGAVISPPVEVKDPQLQPTSPLNVTPPPNAKDNVINGGVYQSSPTHLLSIGVSIYR